MTDAALYLDRAVLDQALAYADRFGEEVEAAIAQNERLERLVTREP